MTETEREEIREFMRTLVFDRTAADVAAKNRKGTYDALDWNRVMKATNFVRTLLEEYGSSIPASSAPGAPFIDVVTASPAQRFIAHVHSIDGVIRYSDNPIRIPETLSRLTYEGANSFERYLYEVYSAIERMEQAWVYADEIYSGEYQ